MPLSHTQFSEVFLFLSFSFFSPEKWIGQNLWEFKCRGPKRKRSRKGEKRDAQKCPLPTFLFICKCLHVRGGIEKQFFFLLLLAVKDKRGEISASVLREWRGGWQFSESLYELMLTCSHRRHRWETGGKGRRKKVGLFFFFQGVTLDNEEFAWKWHVSAKSISENFITLSKWDYQGTVGWIDWLAVHLKLRRKKNLIHGNVKWEKKIKKKKGQGKHLAPRVQCDSKSKTKKIKALNFQGKRKTSNLVN